jgi:hypothetical protein
MGEVPHHASGLQDPAQHRAQRMTPFWLRVQGSSHQNYGYRATREGYGIVVI